MTKLIPFLLIIMAFTFVYMFMPNTRVKFSAALVGAVVGGALWQSTGLVFAEFASSSTKYAAIYSGFAILVLFMIWLYLSWFILLLGSQVAYYVQYPEQIRLSNQRVPLSGRLREQMALLTIYWIAHRFVRHKKPLSIEELCQLLAIPAERVAETVQMLMDRELVVETNDEPSTYVLQSDPANMTVAEFLQIVRRPNDEQSMMNDQIQSVGGVDEVMAQLESSVGEKLAGLTLRKLVDDGKPD